MPDTDANENACRKCGRNSWRFVVISEPVDWTRMFTWAEKEVEYKVCPCGYKERVRIIGRDRLLF